MQTILALLCAALAIAVVFTPVPEPELLMPETLTLRRALMLLVPAWVDRRRRRGQHESLEEARTIAWITRVRDLGTESDRFTIGVGRHGEPVNVSLPHSVPPWAAAPTPPSVSGSMIPERPVPNPVPLVPLSAPAAPEKFWWMDKAEPARLDQPEKPAETRPWVVGDSGDPPTIVKGLRVILDEDLGPYIEGLPGYDKE